MKIGLYGIGGVYNFGCEAIVRGAFQFAKDICPDCEVVYFTKNYEYDSRALKDVGIELADVYKPPRFLHKLLNKGLRLLNINKQFLNIDYKKIAAGADIFLSIGGDIYTVPEINQNKKKFYFFNPVLDFFSTLIKKQNKVLLYGASVGPWGTYHGAINYYYNALKKYCLILCRENVSLNFLREAGLSNALFFPDPAFQVSVPDGQYEKKYIGLNFSPLSFLEVYGGCSDLDVMKIAALCDLIYDKYQINLLFIPHVVANDVRDNDLAFMEKVKQRMSNKGKVTIARADGGFLGIKRQIRECHIVAASRMHCAINAIHENVPTIFISYSKKSLGMCRYIYGDEKWSIPLGKTEPGLVGLMGQLLAKRDDVSAYLNNRNLEIKRDYENNLEIVKQRLFT